MTSQEIQVTNTGISGLWVLANISYAGKRAQNNNSKLWRVLAFIVGLPGTIVTFFAVKGTTARMGLTCPERAGHKCDNISIPTAHSEIVYIRSSNDCWSRPTTPPNRISEYQSTLKT